MIKELTQIVRLAVECLEAEARQEIPAHELLEILKEHSAQARNLGHNCTKTPYAR